MTKKCPSCNTVKELEHFDKDRTKSKGVHVYCKECKSRKYKEYRKTQKGRDKERRAGWKRQQINISNIEYSKKLKQQNNCCAICGVNLKDTDWLCVDHNHTTGKVRGLLCNNCNLGLGNFKDNITILLKAIDYIKDYT